MTLYCYLLGLGVGVLSISHFQFPMGWRRQRGGEGGGPGGEQGLLRLQASPNCGAVIQFKTYGARLKILNLYTSHFERELEDDNSHLLDSGDWLHTVPDEEAVRPGNSLSLVNSPKNLCSHICQVTQNRKRLHGE